MNSNGSNIYLANALGLFSPAITLVLFALLSSLRGERLDTTTAFTTIAILGLVTHPANMVMTVVPRIVAAMSAFDRIQTFLLRTSLQNTRQNIRHEPQTRDSDLSASLTQQETPSLVVQIRDLQIGGHQPILDNVSIDIVAGSLTIISGATGSGKTLLLRTILGEVVPSNGTVKVALTSCRMAYCAQNPWLPSGTIKEVISGAVDGFNSSDECRYREVVRICCLNHDFASLPLGDQTQIGSQGHNLSGGQRQRVVCISPILFMACKLTRSRLWPGLYLLVAM